ncbi:hypothetical protein F4824DRAFT_493766 [Ustulina deusta]|nr:hypothetical protein F4824DRAFT_493766 [Ustulina deusta]
MASSSQRPVPSGDFNTKLDLLNPWNNIPSSLHSPAPSSYRSSFSRPLSPSPGSPISTGLLSPIVHKRESAYPAGSLCFRNSRGSAELKSGYDGDGGDDNSVSPPYQTLQRYEFVKNSYAASTLRTPSATPEPRGDDVYSRMSSLSLGHDPIIENLNRFRTVNKKNPLPPLPPLEGLPCQEVHSQASRKWETVQDASNEPRLQLQQCQKTKRRRRKFPKASHCNIKYTIEESDYIRYHRVDLVKAWKPVESTFRAMFPMAVFPRAAGGLQGVYYRQHTILPLISNGQLVFMENGHVQPVTVKTKEQSDRTHMFTLIYLYPERAMKYPWVALADRQRAYKLNQDRQMQKEKARLEATENGTYVEKLPSDEPCGCCPGEDRKRNKGCGPADLQPDNKAFPSFPKTRRVYLRRQRRSKL